MFCPVVWGCTGCWQRSGTDRGSHARVFLFCPDVKVRCSCHASGQSGDEMQTFVRLRVNMHPTHFVWQLRQKRPAMQDCFWLYFFALVCVFWWVLFFPPSYEACFTSQTLWLSHKILIIVRFHFSPSCFCSAACKVALQSSAIQNIYLHHNSIFFLKS